MWRPFLTGIAIGLVANGVCWGLFFVTRPVLDGAELARIERDLRDVTPRAVAERPVYPHGDALSMYLYQCASFPGLLAGSLLNEGGVEGGFWIIAHVPVGDELLRWVAPIWCTSRGRSWYRAATWFVGTSIWWGLVGGIVSVGALRKWRARHHEDSPGEARKEAAA